MLRIRRAGYRNRPVKELLMAVILALDQGTTSSRAIVFDAYGRVLGMDQREFPQLFPRPGWVEHNPAAIWESQRDSAIRALSKAGAAANDIAALGITNQRETTILWERSSGRPVANAIVWKDRRTEDRCEAIRASVGKAERVTELTGLVVDPYFSATKIAWLLDNIEGLRDRANTGEIAFGTVDSWLIWNLTDGERHVTDVTNASRTMLFDIHTLAWNDELLQLFNVPRAVLPEVLPCTSDFGTTGSLGSRTRICGVAGDQQAALLGQAGFMSGMAKNTYGTGSFVVLNTGASVVRSSHGLLSTIAYSFDGKVAHYALEGSIFSTGSAVQWLRDGLGIIASSGEVERLAREVPDAGGVFLVPAFTGLGAPYWDANARAALLGLTRGTTRAHIARAALEAMAYQTADVVQAMESDAAIPLQELRVDGGASANDTVMQFQADILGTQAVRPVVRETTALGAAYLAGLQSGYWRDTPQIASLWAQERRFEARFAESKRAELMAHWHRAVARTRDWASA